MITSLQRSLKVALLLYDGESHGERLIQALPTLRRLVPHWMTLLLAADEQGVAAIRNSPVDGVIIRRLPEQRLVDNLLDLGIPVVQINPFSQVEGIWPLVDSDQVALGRLQAEHLLRLGHTRLAAFSYDLDQSLWRSRATGVKEAADQAGATCTFVTAADSDALHRVLEDFQAPLGIAACNDQFSYLICQACLRRGIMIPQDAAIIGIDDHQIWCESGSPTLSSVAQDHGALLAAAVRALAALHDGDRPDPVILIPPGPIIQRGSSDAPGGSDPLMARLLPMIRTLATRGLTVEDLVSRSGLGRRGFFKKFHESFGATPLDVIQGERIRVAQHLLRTSDMSLQDIGAAAGFSSPTRFSEAFRRATGATPRDWRKATGPEDSGR